MIREIVTVVRKEKLFFKDIEQCSRMGGYQIWRLGGDFLTIVDSRKEYSAFIFNVEGVPITLNQAKFHHLAEESNLH
jgi:hypothetical protein